MTSNYIGVKQVLAWRDQKNDLEGYSIKYPDGYISWSPKQTFEDAYLLQGHDSTKVTQAMVDGMIESLDVSDFDDKTTIVKAILKSGFTIIEHASCVDPDNYDRSIGAEIATKRIKEKLWLLLGFVLQWGKDGLSS